MVTAHRGDPRPGWHERSNRALKLMSANRDRLDALAEALLEHETLERDEAYVAAGIETTGGTPVLTEDAAGTPG